MCDGEFGVVTGLEIYVGNYSEGPDFWTVKSGKIGAREGRDGSTSLTRHLSILVPGGGRLSLKVV